MNELILNIYKSVENLRHLKINSDNLNDFTHYVKLDFINKNNILELIKILNFKKIHLIKKVNIIKRIKRFESKNNSHVVCNCSSTCICLENNYNDIEEFKSYYLYKIVKLDEINNLDSNEIFGLVFNLI
jgi:hypothetical protein